MKKQLILASHNENKVHEFRSLLQNTNFEILSLDDLNITLDVEENGATFQDNALLKAKAIHDLTGLPTIADDSGLIINALNNFPGVMSARFMADKTYSEKNKTLIAMLANHSDKSAKFVCAIALVGLDLFPQVLVGEAKGIIIEEERGSDGFGYDPIFFYPNAQKTFAEMTTLEKEAVSHRGHASEKLVNYLNEFHS